MKKIITLYLIFTCNSFSQFKINYKEIQSKYSPLNSEDSFEDSFIETKSINDFEQIKFCFSKKDSTLLTVNFKHLNSCSESEFVKILNEYIRDYKPIKTKEWEYWTLYYDEKNKIIVIKEYENSMKSKIKQISMIYDQHTVESMLRYFEIQLKN